MNHTDIFVVIPYLACEAQGHELEYAVAGWHKHFKEPHRIVVVGDRDEVVERLLICEDGKTEGKITFLDCPRINPQKGQYLPHLDIVNKLSCFLYTIPALSFVKASDDQYAIRDFTLEDIRRPKINAWEIPPQTDIPDFGTVDWWHDLCKTRDLCLDHHLPIMDWSTHLPAYYNSRLLKLLVDMFDMRDVSYVLESVYFNLLRAEINNVNKVTVPDMSTSDIEFMEPEVHTLGNKWKLEIRDGALPFTKVEQAGTIWINNSRSGWSPQLELKLHQHYFSAQ